MALRAAGRCRDRGAGGDRRNRRRRVLGAQPGNADHRRQRRDPGRALRLRRQRLVPLLDRLRWACGADCLGRPGRLLDHLRPADRAGRRQSAAAAHLPLPFPQRRRRLLLRRAARRRRLLPADGRRGLLGAQRLLVCRRTPAGDDEHRCLSPALGRRLDHRRAFADRTAGRDRGPGPLGYQPRLPPGQPLRERGSRRRRRRPRRARPPAQLPPPDLRSRHARVHPALHRRTDPLRRRPFQTGPARRLPPQRRRSGALGDRWLENRPGDGDRAAARAHRLRAGGARRSGRDLRTGRPGRRRCRGTGQRRRLDRVQPPRRRQRRLADSAARPGGRDRPQGAGGADRLPGGRAVLDGDRRRLAVPPRLRPAPGRRPGAAHPRHLPPARCQPADRAAGRPARRQLRRQPRRKEGTAAGSHRRTPAETRARALRQGQEPPARRQRPRADLPAPHQGTRAAARQVRGQGRRQDAALHDEEGHPQPAAAPRPEALADQARPPGPRGRQEEGGMSARRRDRALFALACLVALLTATLWQFAASGAGAEDGGALVAQPYQGAPALAFLGASPQEAPGEVWAIARGGTTLAHYSDAGGWETVPAPVDAEGQPIAGLEFAAGAAAGRTTPRGGIVAAATAGEEQPLLVVRDPGGPLRAAPEPPSAVLGPEEALFAPEGGSGPLLTALEGSGGDTRALVVPTASSEVTEAVLRFAAGNWSREPICVGFAAGPACTAPASPFRVLAIEAGGGEAWLLAKGATPGEGIELFRREATGGVGGVPVWRQQSLGLAASLGSSFAQAAPLGVPLTARVAGQPLTVTAAGVWVDAQLTSGGEKHDATIYYDIGAGEVTGSWCALTSPAGLCTQPLGAELPSGQGRSFAWPPGGTSGPFGQRVITGVGQGAILSLEGSAFARIALGGGSAGAGPGAPLGAPA